MLLVKLLSVAVCRVLLLVLSVLVIVLYDWFTVSYLQVAFSLVSRVSVTPLDVIPLVVNESVVGDVVSGA